MGIKLAAASGGSVELVPTNTASNFTVTVPAGTGTMVVSGASSAITSGTAVASTSGTSIDFTSIPSWVKRITVMFNGVSTNGTSDYLLQIGSGSVTTTGYSSGGTFQGSTNVVGNRNTTAGFIAPSAALAANLAYGTVTLCLLTGNTWIASCCLGINPSGTSYSSVAGGVSPSLGGALDRVRITTVNGTDTFDAGSINILYE